MNRLLLLALTLLALSGCQSVSGLDGLEADRPRDAGRVDAIRNGDSGRNAVAARRDGGDSGAGGCAGADRDCSERSSGASGGARALAGAGGTRSERADAGIRDSAADDAAVPAIDSGTADCATRITYGSAWIRPSAHPATTWDDASGLVTWDGSCELDAAGNSVATLSNGWRPFFRGVNACVIALDVSGSCAPAGGCATRLHYGPSWLSPADHPEPFDDAPGAITTDGVCASNDEQSWQRLSNGWEPHFSGSDSCSIALRYSQCGGLYANPVISADCLNLSVLREGDQYVMACTSSNPEYPILTSDDLVHWTPRTTIFSEHVRPVWATQDFWAPEIHHVGDQFVAYFSARHADGDLAVGAATATDVLGPYRDVGAPLLRAARGVIDPHQFEAQDGTRYLIWSTFDNADGAPVSIKLQPLAADGLTLTGSAITLVSSEEPWEGGWIEHPWLILEAGRYYLFYAANDYRTDRYVVGVARADVVTGPYTKAPGPILQTSGGWVRPTVGSAVRSPDGGWAFVFDAWPEDRVDEPSARQVLVTRIGWADGWPTMLAAPSSVSQPLP